MTFSTATGQARKYQGLIYASILVLVFAIALGLSFWYANRERVEMLEDGTRKVSAPKGELVKGFPRELILEDKPAVSESYVLEYKDGMNLQAVEYISESNLYAEIEEYTQFLFNNDWSISRFADPGERPTTFFYAARGDAEVNITFRRNNLGKLIINIAYTDRKAT